MKLFNWFKPKNKHNVVLPEFDNTKLLHGLELVKAFTTATEPKVKDFPRTEYKVYWETLLDTIDGGYQAVVRFYPFDNTAKFEEQHFTNANLQALKDDVNRAIHMTMAKNAR